MTEQRWIEWRPTDNIQGIHNVSLLTNSYETGFRIVLINSEKELRIEIAFVNGVDFYSCTDESFNFMRISQVKKKQGESFFDRDWSFYEIIDSPKVNQLRELSGGVSEDIPFRHFVILGSDEFVDLVDSTEPEVRVFDDKII